MHLCRRPHSMPRRTSAPLMLHIVVYTCSRVLRMARAPPSSNAQSMTMLTNVDSAFLVTRCAAPWQARCLAAARCCPARPAAGGRRWAPRACWAAAVLPLPLPLPHPPPPQCWPLAARPSPCGSPRSTAGVCVGGGRRRVRCPMSMIRPMSMIHAHVNAALQLCPELAAILRPGWAVVYK